MTRSQQAARGGDRRPPSRIDWVFGEGRLRAPMERDEELARLVLARLGGSR